MTDESLARSSEAQEASKEQNTVREVSSPFSKKLSDAVYDFRPQSEPVTSDPKDSPATASVEQSKSETPKATDSQPPKAAPASAAKGSSSAPSSTPQPSSSQT